MADARLEQKVREIVADQLGIGEDEIALDSKLDGDLGADSLDLVELFMALEEEFEVEIPQEVTERLETVGSLIAFLEEQAS